MKLMLTVAVGLAIVLRSGHAVELGLTPSHVFSLWTNINAAVVTMGSAVTGDGDVSRRLAAMPPTAFHDKTPSNVIEQVAAFRDKLDRLNAASGLKATQVYRDPEGGEVTPSVVFLNSGHVLDSLVLLLIRSDSERLVGGFYARHEFGDKTPSNVFGLVELANRRMAALMRTIAN
jgi:hypothetical protein